MYARACLCCPCWSPALQIASNPCVAYVQHIVLPWFNKFDVERTEANGGNKCACVACSCLILPAPAVCQQQSAGCRRAGAV